MAASNCSFVFNSRYVVHMIDCSWASEKWDYLRLTGWNPGLCSSRLTNGINNLWLDVGSLWNEDTSSQVTHFHCSHLWGSNTWKECLADGICTHSLFVQERIASRCYITNLRLRIISHNRTCHKNSDIVLSFIFHDIIGRCEELDVAHIEACLF